MILVAEIGILLANLVVLGLGVKLYTDQSKQQLLRRGPDKPSEAFVGDYPNARMVRPGRDPNEHHVY